MEPEHYAALVRRFRHDIPAFFLFAFDMTLRPKQVEYVNAFKDNKRIAHKGGVGYGKTRATAGLVHWSMVCFDDLAISVFGPTELQLDGGLWGDIVYLHSIMPPEFRDQLDVNSTRILRKGSSSAKCLKRIANAITPEANKGVHAKNNFTFVDEASGVLDPVFPSLTNIFTDENPKLCLVSNPSRASGYFYDCFHHPEKSKLWTKVSGSIRDNPNLSEQDIADLTVEKGGIHSNDARSSILGEFPLSDTGGLIPSEAVIAAIEANGVVPNPSIAPIWGLDPAGDGEGDRSVLLKRHDNVVLGAREWRAKDSIELAHAVKVEYDATPKHLRPSAIAVDVIGVGKGAFDQLAALGLPAVRVSVSNKAASEDHDRLRDTLWFKTRDWFVEGTVRIPNLPDLITELCNVQFKVTPRGKTKAESKKEMRKRLKASPDYADALCLTFAENASRATGKYAWNKPLPATDMRAFY